MSEFLSKNSNSFEGLPWRRCRRLLRGVELALTEILHARKRGFPLSTLQLHAQMCNHSRNLNFSQHCTVASLMVSCWDGPTPSFGVPPKSLHCQLSEIEVTRKNMSIRLPGDNLYVSGSNFAFRFTDYCSISCFCHALMPSSSTYFDQVSVDRGNRAKVLCVFGPGTPE